MKLFYFLVWVSLVGGFLLTVYGIWVTMIGGESLSGWKKFGDLANMAAAVFTVIATIYTIFTLWYAKRFFVMVALIIATFVSIVITVWGEVFPQFFVPIFSKMEYANFKSNKDVITSSYLFGGLAILGFAASLLNPKIKK